jgi:hypothetical protein
MVNGYYQKQFLALTTDGSQSKPLIWACSGINQLFGWWFQPLSKILVSWDDCSQYMEK